MMPRARLELARTEVLRILSPVCLPIPPPGHTTTSSLTREIESENGTHRALFLKVLSETLKKLALFPGRVSTTNSTTRAGGFCGGWIIAG